MAITLQFESTSTDSADADDPALGSFLGLLANNLAAHLQRVTPLNAEWRHRIQSLVGKVEIDLDATLPDEECRNRVGFTFPTGSK